MENKSLKTEVVKQVVTLATAGFGFVAALAWNEAIQALLKSILPSSGSTLIGKFVYAILVTVIVVIVTTRLGRMTETLKQK